jgi:hypothetical protein
MMTEPYNYRVFFDFIESYLPSGFSGINPDDPIMQKLDGLMEMNDQFITVADLGQIKFLHVSKGIRQMIGVEPGQLHPGNFVEVAHPDDLTRLGLLRAQTFIVEKEVLETQTGSALVSFTIRMRNPSGVYNHYLCQAYFFYTPIPRKVVYLLQVITRIDWFRMKNQDYHHYKGKNLSLFKFPDEELLKIGPGLSEREFEIIRQIELGLSSKQIAEKLFLSVHTVNTHRKNILEKSGKSQISDLIYTFKDQGLL